MNQTISAASIAIPASEGDLHWSVFAYDAEDLYADDMVLSIAELTDPPAAIAALTEYADHIGLRVEQTSAAADGREFSYALRDADDAVVIYADIWRSDL